MAAQVYWSALLQRKVIRLSLCSPRIKKSGGFVTWNSLGQPNVNGRLAMTRSIGDFDLKNMGVIAQPETRRIKVRGSMTGCNEWPWLAATYIGMAN